MRRVALVLLAACLARSSVRAGDVRIIRDKWGVPRIFSDTGEGAAFGFGYAQAEDRIEAMLKHYLEAQGLMASVFGPSHLEEDYRQVMLGHGRIAEDRFCELSPRCRSYLEAFAAGVNRWMQDHPDRTPSWAFPVKAWHPIAIMRYAVWGWPVGQAVSDLGRRPRGRVPGFGSNQWAVSAHRTAPGCVITCIDPHVGWDGNLRWVEAHLHGGDMHTYGFTLAGTPIIALGHSDFLSWAMTTGGPDTADVYVLKLDEARTRYRYDDQWRPITETAVSLQVKDPASGQQKTVTRTIRRSHHGPIVEEQQDKAFAMKLAYENEVALADQYLRMNLARTLESFMAALDMNQYIPQNIMAGDVDGNIFYQRTGRVPIRPTGYQWNHPVPGSTAATEWQGLHHQDELVHCLNPPQGFFQNCNIGPDTMMPDSPLTADRYPPYIYGTGPNAWNPRGRRAVELLAADSKLSVDRARSIALDTTVWGYDGWIKAVQRDLASTTVDTETKEAVELLAAWDGRMARQSEAATLFLAWKRTLREQNFDGNLATPPDPGRSFHGMLARALTAAQNFLKATYGTWRVQWGRVNRAVRGEQDWAIAGASHGSFGISTLRAAGARWQEQTKTFRLVSGQTCTTVVALRGPGKVQSFSALPYGQSDDPASPHYTDQGRMLFGKEMLKDSYYRREDELPSVESRITITYPDALRREKPSAGPVTDADMERVVRTVATPYKLGRPVLAPTGTKGDFDADLVDCPHVFRFRDSWYMTYIGHDGSGYRTGLATSDDLITWKRCGMILDKGDAHAFDAHGAAGLSILGDWRLFSGHHPVKQEGRYLMTYYGNDKPGYEAGIGCIGCAESTDLRTWKRVKADPILRPQDGGAWEAGTLYKSFILRGDDGRFYLFYNAKDKGSPWKEAIGLATSTDLATWKRHPENPVVRPGSPGTWDARFTSDPVVFRWDDLYVMFYYGYDGGNAREGLAVSRDLHRWRKWPEPIIDVGPAGAGDSQHAHKPSVVWHKGVFYHFYCCVRSGDGYRAITVATSRELTER